MNDSPSGVVDILATHRLLAILRYPEGGDISGALQSLQQGGIAVAEVTVTSPGWADAVDEAATSGMCVGAGTVLTAAAVADAAAAGARFVVTPGFDPEIVRNCLDRDLVPIPGVLTPSEVMQAQRAGVEAFKLFPAGPMGTAYLAALRGPFPQLQFVPTGGIALDDVRNWLDVGACAVALGSDLAGRSAPASEEECAALVSRAQRAVAGARS